jgi:uracil-DNA glycosylase
MTQTVNIEDVKNKLYIKLKDSGWGDRLKTFIQSSDFDQILAYLLGQVNQGKRFTPPLKQVFSAFEKCKYSDLKVVIVGQDPYPYEKIADGMAFSCSNDGKIQASLRYINKAIQHTVYNDLPLDYKSDLTPWAEQGILLLNASLTTEINKIGKHYHIWTPFITFLLDMLNAYNPGLVYVFMGKKAQEWMDQVSDNNHKLICSHPASAAYINQEMWDCNDVFNKTSKLVKDHYAYDIIW